MTEQYLEFEIHGIDIDVFDFNLFVEYHLKLDLVQITDYNIQKATRESSFSPPKQFLKVHLSLKDTSLKDVILANINNGRRSMHKGHKIYFLIPDQTSQENQTHNAALKVQQDALGKVLRCWSGRRVAAAFFSWVEAAGALARREKALTKIVKRWAGCRLGEGFYSWQEAAGVLAKQEKALKRVVKLWNGYHVALGFYSWHQAAGILAAQEQILIKMTRRWVKQQVNAAFRSWHEAAGILAAQEQILIKMTRRWVKQQVNAGFRSWHETAGTLAKQERLLVKIVNCWAHRCLGVAFYSWHEISLILSEKADGNEDCSGIKYKEARAPPQIEGELEIGDLVIYEINAASGEVSGMKNQKGMQFQAEMSPSAKQKDLAYDPDRLWEAAMLTGHGSDGTYTLALQGCEGGFAESIPEHLIRRIKTKIQKVADFEEQANSALQTARERGVTDWTTLIQLYQATNGPNWDHQGCWLSEKPLSMWMGVTVQEGVGSVTVLDLKNRGLTGQAPAVIAELKNLKIVDLSKNALEGTLSRSIFSLTQLQEVDLGENNLSGSLPRSLSQLTELEVLKLNNNRLYGTLFPEVFEAKSLRQLDLSNNCLTGNLILPQADSNVLEQLNLAGNQLKGPLSEAIALLKNLKVLNLSHNALTGPIPKQLGSLRFLKHLQLNHNCLKGLPPPEIGLCQELQTVHFHNNPDLTGNLPAEYLSNKDLDLRTDNTGLVWTADSEDQAFALPAYPFFVIPRDELLGMSTLVMHEEAGEKEDTIKPGILERLTMVCKFTLWIGKDFAQVKREDIAYISHRWLRPRHPDLTSNLKLRKLQALARAHPEWKYFWVDFVCIPQSAERALDKQKAISSLPHYVNACGTLVILCQETGQASLDVYKSRGWCRLEQLASLCPIKGEVLGSQTGEQEVETKVLVFNQDDELLTPFRAEETQDEDKINPLKGKFTYNEDKDTILPCLQNLCFRLERVSKDKHLRRIVQSVLNCNEYKQTQRLLKVQDVEERETLNTTNNEGQAPNIEAINEEADSKKEKYMENAAQRQEKSVAEEAQIVDAKRSGCKCIIT